MLRDMCDVPPIPAEFGHAGQYIANSGRGNGVTIASAGIRIPSYLEVNRAAFPVPPRPLEFPAP